MSIQCKVAFAVMASVIDYNNYEIINSRLIKISLSWTHCLEKLKTFAASVCRLPIDVTGRTSCARSPDVGGNPVVARENRGRSFDAQPAEAINNKVVTLGIWLT